MTRRAFLRFIYETSRGPAIKWANAPTLERLKERE